MEPEESHIAWYNRGRPEGLLPPGRDTRNHNIELLQKRNNERLEELEKMASLLNIIIHSRQEFIGTACISGDATAIEQLKKHLEEKGWGTVTPNSEITLIE